MVLTPSDYLLLALLWTLIICPILSGMSHFITAGRLIWQLRQASCSLISGWRLFSAATQEYRSKVRCGKRDFGGPVRISHMRVPT